MAGVGQKAVAGCHLAEAGGASRAWVGSGGLCLSPVLNAAIQLERVWCYWPPLGGWEVPWLAEKLQKAGQTHSHHQMLTGCVWPSHWMFLSGSREVGFLFPFVCQLGDIS